MNYARFEELVKGFATGRVLVVGDIMVDEFLWGKVSRISPEAPIPVVEVTKETLYAGGAANVARNLAEFSGQVGILGLVGQDEAAGKMRGILASARISHPLLLEDPDFTTVVKTRVIARSQQLVRVDREKRFALNQTLRDRLKGMFQDALPDFDAVIFEDYGKGLIDQQVASDLVALAREAGKIVTVDPNPRNPLEWKGATAMKPNRLEAFLAAGMRDEGALDAVLEDRPLREAGDKLLDIWQCEQVLITLSEHGMLLFERGKTEQPYHTQKSQEVFDVSGAGDTAIALYTLALNAGSTPPEAVQIANHGASRVVGKIGTATISQEELLKSLAEEWESSHDSS